MKYGHYEDEVCPRCGNTTDNGLDPDFGICDYCMETTLQRKSRQRSELIEAFESGHDVDLRILK